MLNFILENTIPKKKILSKVIIHSINFMLVNISEDITLQTISHDTGYSKFTICKHFLSTYDIGPIKFLWDLRINIAYEIILIYPDISNIYLSVILGFKSPSHFCRYFKKYYGQTPSKFKLEYLKRNHLINATIIDFEHTINLLILSFLNYFNITENTYATNYWYSF